MLGAHAFFEHMGHTLTLAYLDYINPEKHETGIYSISLMYASNGDGTMALDVDGQRVTNQLAVSSTFNAKDTIARRQWHHWDKLNSLADIKLLKGSHALTLRTVGHGNMNFVYLEFRRHDCQRK